MVKESQVFFERNVEGEEAIVISDAMSNLDNPSLQALLDKIGVSLPLFQNLVKKECDWMTQPERGEFISEGQKLEDFERRVASTELGPVEVVDVKLYPGAINPNDIGMHLKQSSLRGFEAILVAQGSATMRIPDRVDPVGDGLYARSEEFTDVNITKGDLMLIPAPTANGWTKASSDFKFRYICLPPWNKNFVAPTV